MLVEFRSFNVQYFPPAEYFCSFDFSYFSPPNAPAFKIQMRKLRQCVIPHFTFLLFYYILSPYILVNIRTVVPVISQIYRTREAQKFAKNNNQNIDIDLILKYINRKVMFPLHSHKPEIIKYSPAVSADPCIFLLIMDLSIEQSMFSEQNFDTTNTFL